MERSHLSSMQSTAARFVFKLEETHSNMTSPNFLVVHSKSEYLCCSHKILRPQAHTCSLGGEKPRHTQDPKGGRAWQSTESQPGPVLVQDEAEKGTGRLFSSLVCPTPEGHLPSAQVLCLCPQQTPQLFDIFEGPKLFLYGSSHINPILHTGPNAGKRKH